MVDKVLASIVLTVCLVFMLRLLVGARRQRALDAWARRTALAIRGGALRIYHWRSSRKTAERVAEEAIRRARGEGSWEGNVYKPKSFKRPPRDKLH